jgi:hypothetical protein
MAKDSNPLKDLLAQGYKAGVAYAGTTLFGTEAGDETQRQEEINARGKINGSGPVNSSAALAAPKSWTDYFFGSRQASTASDGTPPPSDMPRNVIVGLVVVAALWWVFRKR